MSSATPSPKWPRSSAVPAACRQLGSSARRRIRASQTPATPTAQQADIVRNFKQAWEAKDIDALIGLLDPDATAIGDGGGLVSAELRPIEGSQQIARAVVNVAGRAPDLTILERTVNGQPGLVAQQDGVTVVVIAFDIAVDRIKHIWAVRTPRSYDLGRRADAGLRGEPAAGSLGSTKFKEMVSTQPGITVEQLARITAATLVVVGDDDIVTLDDTSTLFRAIQDY